MFNAPLFLSLYCLRDSTFVVIVYDYERLSVAIVMTHLSETIELNFVAFTAAIYENLSWYTIDVTTKMRQ